MLMLDKPTRYHSHKDTNTNTAQKTFYSLLKLNARMPSSSVAVTLHPFDHSCIFMLLGRVWVVGETAAAPTFTSGSTSTTLRTAFPSRTRRILSESKARVPVLGSASFNGGRAAKACQQALPSRCRSVCDAIAASMACSAVGTSLEEVRDGAVGPSFGDDGGEG